MLLSPVELIKVSQIHLRKQEENPQGQLSLPPLVAMKFSHPM
jgi:hypothetical protein